MKCLHPPSRTSVVVSLRIFSRYRIAASFFLELYGLLGVTRLPCYGVVSLQIQEQKEMYRGTYDALRKIYAAEGVGGFYRGFWVNSMQVRMNFGLFLVSPLTL